MTVRQIISIENNLGGQRGGEILYAIKKSRPSSVLRNRCAPRVPAAGIENQANGHRVSA
jgi:hypothetical protein